MSGSDTIADRHLTWTAPAARFVAGTASRVGADRRRVDGFGRSVNGSRPSRSQQLGVHAWHYTTTLNYTLTVP